MTHREIRIWYAAELDGLRTLDAEWLRRGESLEQRAHKNWQFRRDLRLRARELMPEPTDLAKVRDMDRERYGDPDGPTFSYLVAKGRAAGLSMEETCRRIIESAQRPNEAINKLFGL